MSYDAMLFDMDGVLLRGGETDSEIYETATHQALSTITNKDVSDLDLDEACDFHYTDKMKNMCESIGVELENFWKKREDIAAELENYQIIHGEKQPYDDIDILEDLAQSHKLGVVSNNRQATVDQMVSTIGIEFINVAIGRDHSIKAYYTRKPDPTLIQDAIKTIDTENAVYIGDRETDIIAAHRAGIDGALIRRPHNLDLEIRDQPDIVLDSLVDLNEI